MENVTQLAIVPEAELKAMEVIPTPGVWIMPKGQPIFKRSIPKILYTEEIQHLSSRNGARRFKKVITPPQRCLLIDKNVNYTLSYRK